MSWSSLWDRIQKAMPFGGGGSSTTTSEDPPPRFGRSWGEEPCLLLAFSRRRLTCQCHQDERCGEGWKYCPRGFRGDDGKSRFAETGAELENAGMVWLLPGKAARLRRLTARTFKSITPGRERDRRNRLSGPLPAWNYDVKCIRAALIPLPSCLLCRRGGEKKHTKNRHIAAKICRTACLLAEPPTQSGRKRDLWLKHPGGRLAGWVQERAKKLTPA